MQWNCKRRQIEGLQMARANKELDWDEDGDLAGNGFPDRPFSGAGVSLTGTQTEQGRTKERKQEECNK